MKLSFKSILFILLAGIGTSCRVQKQGNNGLSKEFVDKQLQVAAAHYNVLMKNTPPDKLPRTWEGGELKTTSSSGWVSGFYPGTLLYLYEHSRDPMLLQEAERRLKLLEKEQYNTGTHDLGFMLYCSFGNAYRLTGKESYKNILLRGAESLIERYDPKVGCIRSWGKIEDNKEFLVIIDNMMNLEFLSWASKTGGDERFADIAVRHANTTMENHFRPDYSSWHVLNYDAKSGKVLQKRTAQGAADASAWARGQAWGLYGYTMFYRETGRKEYLDLARNIADFVLEHPRLPEDMVPYWDFDAPGIPDTYRDASSAAIMASALLELSRLSEGGQARRYKAAAEKMLQSLASPEYLAGAEEQGGFLLKHGVGSLPHKSEVDVPLSYGDYYYVEALMRYRNWFL